VTPVDPNSAIALILKSAEPRSCLAVRMARQHASSGSKDSLLPCAVCSQCDGLTTCVPLIVTGEVIGSVLANHQQPLADGDRRRARLRPAGVRRPFPSVTRKRASHVQYRGTHPGFA